MNNTRQAAWAFLLLLALAFSGWYLASQKPPARLDEEGLAKTVDTIVTGLNVFQYGETGRLERTLYTPRLEHTPENGTHRFDNPRVYALQEDGAPVEITAKRGISYREGLEVTFLDDVLLRQMATDKAAESTLETQSITWFPKNSLAITDKAVKFRQSGNEVHSVGMKAHLEERRVELLHTARGFYAPPENHA